MTIQILNRIQSWKASKASTFTSHQSNCSNGSNDSKDCKDTLWRTKSSPVSRLGLKMNAALHYRDQLVRQYNKDLENADYFADQVDVSITTNNHKTFEFIPIPADGTCGFEAIARGVNMAWVDHERLSLSSWSASSSISTSSGFSTTSRTSIHSKLFPRNAHGNKPITAKHVRNKLKDELSMFASFYEEEARTNPAFHYYYSSCSCDQLVNSLSRSGKEAHWLGEKWGNMELLAIARALNICIHLYMYDADSQCIRLCDTLDFGLTAVSLLYSGYSNYGHFDLLYEPPAQVDIRFSSSSSSSSSSSL